ncbi:hypothetical protein LTR36_008581 [Oleoguttula mirabilis]|uniref:NAD-dependent epimerase/dehydratase domain-containing protein n=1 Tax=Oleoguttula mirabilis TaxID=1507867 RepID=A0AAV9JT38_9PEZI|nr:hypothetical protein LTR36_008581 [Oleoguttula mirabilis]
MAPNIFITGGTGYIGGTVLDTVVRQHSEYDVTVLLRKVPDDFSKLADVIADAAAKAHVVVHNGDSDPEKSIKALITGLLRRNEPSFLIHLSGNGIVADWQEGTHIGKLNPKVWSDIDDIDDITSRPDRELHRNVDKIIQAAAAEHGEKLKTAIVCPPDIYGLGRGPGKTVSAYMPAFLEASKRLGAPFYTSDGTNTRSWVHIEDLMTVYLKIVKAAAAGGEGADWGREGYYFASSQEASQIDIAKAASKMLKSNGMPETAEPKAISLEEIAGTYVTPSGYRIGTYMFAANSRTRAHRAAKLSGYSPSAPTVFERMEADLLAASAIRAVRL